MSVATDSKDNVYLFNTGDHPMIVLDSEGNFLRSWGEELLFSWGASGTDPGEFGYPHNVVTDKDGYVYVADRENDRIQIFDSNGRFETQWHNVNRPNGLYITDEQNICVTEAVQNAMARSIPNFPPRISVLNKKGETLARIGNGWGTNRGSSWPRTTSAWTPITRIYMSDLAGFMMPLGGETPPADLRSLHTLVKAS